MTSPAKQHRAGVEDSGAAAGKDKVIVQRGSSVLRGYTHESAWQAELLQGAVTSPPVLFEGEVSPRNIDLTGASIRFVKSFDPRADREPILFHNDGPFAELLWVRLQLHEDAVMEGMLANSEALLQQEMLTLTPTDPETNDLRIVFHRDAVRALQVLGVRSASR